MDFPLAKRLQLLRPPSHSGRRRGRAQLEETEGGWGAGGTMKPSPWPCFLAGAWVLGIREHPEGQGPGTPRDREVGRGLGSEQGALVGNRCAINWAFQPVGDSWGRGSFLHGELGNLSKSLSIWLALGKARSETGD